MRVLARIALIVSIIILYFVPTILFSQSQFVKVLGGAGEEGGVCLIQTVDNGYAIAGNVSEYSALIVKLNELGEIQWAKITDGTARIIAHSLIQTQDSGYIFIGRTYKYIGSDSHYDVLIVKLNQSGNIVWAKEIGDTTKNEWGASLIQTIDGGYALAGSYGWWTGGYDFLFIKLDNSMNIEWTKLIGGAENEQIHYCNSLIQTSDSGYAILGFTRSFGVSTQEFLLIKLEFSGNIEWTRMIGYPSFSAWGAGMIQTQDNGFAIMGWIGSLSGDFFLIKLNEFGDFEWARRIGTPTGEKGHTVVQTQDGGYAIAGITDYGPNTCNILFVKLNSNGDFELARRIRGPECEHDFHLINTSDGGYALTGSTEGFSSPYDEDVIFVKFDANGNTCIEDTVFPQVIPVNPTISSPSVTVTSPSLLIRPSEVSIVDLPISDTSICEVPVIVEETNETISSNIELQVLQNPAFGSYVNVKFQTSDTKNISLSLFNLVGQKVKELEIRTSYPGTYWIKFPVIGLRTGIYFLHLRSGEENKSVKLAIVK
jgi:hypothetical protein